MLRCCACVRFPPTILIGTHSVALVETDSVKLCFLYGMMRAMDGSPLSLHRIFELRIFFAQLFCGGAYSVNFGIKLFKNDNLIHR
uniref:SFRICE_023482 n=1 Tax=Spodoptera frugiperda TaxID=7108 RepID=A0A2H1VFA0_SPOFR